MTEHFFTKADPGSDPGKITTEVARRARYLQLVHQISYQDAVEAALIADPGLEAKYSQLGDAPTVVSWDGKSSIGSPRLEAE